MEILTDPWAWWVEPFVDNVFMQRALAAGLLTGLCTAVVGTWVVLRGMAFLGDALAHGVLPGIAVAFIIGADTMIGALVAAGVMVAALGVIDRHSPLPTDTSIGLLFVGMLALTVVIMSRDSAGYAGDLNRFLFGSITGVDGGDLVRQAAVAAVTVAGVVVLYRSLLVTTFDELQAQIMGLRPRLASAVLLVLVALSIVASFEAVGNLLVFAFLVAPPATATLLVRSVPRIMVVAVSLSALAALIGTLVSFHGDTAAGATMALTSVVIYLVILTGRGLITVARSRALAARS